ncbi:MAG: helix-turn-helix domain-containing protein [Acidibacillus sp.]|nr:helix-turn-helix domain-containing protein [Acidibacillus sp.]
MKVRNGVDRLRYHRQVIEAFLERMQFVEEVPADVVAVPEKEVRAGIMIDDHVWFLMDDGYERLRYAYVTRDLLNTTEWQLLRLILLHFRGEEEAGHMRWETRLTDALHETPEAFASAIRIEDDIENMTVPWSWPVFLISVRPKNSSVQEVSSEIRKTLESLGQGPEESPYVVIDQSLIVGIFPLSNKERGDNGMIVGEETAYALVDGLLSESFIEGRVVWSEPIKSFPELLRTAKRMLYLILTAERFIPDQRVLSMRGLGIYELLYSIKPNLRQAYADHVLPVAAITALGNELEQTVTIFIQCDLNMSETARRLYLHRNSLLYRIERIRELTGYDIRRFDDAMTVWSALLLNRL